MSKDYCSPALSLESEERTPSPFLVAFYDMPGKVWAAGIFFVPVPARKRKWSGVFTRSFYNGYVFYWSQLEETVRGDRAGRSAELNRLEDELRNNFAMVKKPIRSIYF